MTEAEKKVIAAVLSEQRERHAHEKEWEAVFALDELAVALADRLKPWDANEFVKACRA